MGGVAWTGDSCGVKGKWSHEDRTGLSPHLFSGQALFSLALGCREETRTVHSSLHSICQPCCREALWRVLTTALSSSFRHAPWTPWTLPGALYQACQGFFEQCYCGDCLFCLQYLPFSVSSLLSFSTDVNFSSFAALLLYFPYSKKSKTS